MLKEKNFYKDELPVNVVVGNIREYPIHFHDDIEIVSHLLLNTLCKHFAFLRASGIKHLRPSDASVRRIAVKMYAYGCICRRTVEYLFSFF